MILSIILPVYNAEKYLVNCINSLIEQDLSLSDYEIIIINDGSKDSSPKIANNYASKYANISVYNQSNRGLGATRNIGVTHAKGDYIYYIDSDDYIVHKSLGTLVYYLKKEHCDILTFKSHITDSLNLNKSQTKIHSDINTISLDGVSYLSNNAYRNEVWWYIINREFLLKSEIKFTEGRWLEDGIYTASLFLKANKIVPLPFDIHRYVKSPGSIMSNMEKNHYKKMIYDMADSASLFNDLIQEISPTIKNEDCLTRLKSRQESYSFFLIIRFFRSNLKFKELQKILTNLRKSNSYPIRYFLKKDHNTVKYHFLSIIFNNKVSLYLSFNAFRLIKRFFSLKNYFF